MPNTDPEQLERFLANNAVMPTMVPAAMKLMEPLFDAANYNQLCYAAASAVLSDWVKTAMSKTLGCTVAEARFISLEKPFERPDWMPAGVARLVANAAMMKLVNDGTSLNTFDQFMAQFRQPSTVTQAQKTLGSRLDERLRHCLMGAFGQTMRQYIEPLADVAVSQLAIRIVTNTLHTYLFQVMAGNQTIVAAMAPTIKLLNEICPWAVIGTSGPVNYKTPNYIVITLVHKIKAPAP